MDYQRELETSMNYKLQMEAGEMNKLGIKGEDMHEFEHKNYHL